MLVTLNEIKLWLKVQPDDTSNDATLELLGVVVSDFVEQFCNRKFTLTTYLEIYDTHETPIVFLKNRPITKVFYVKYLGINLGMEGLQIDKPRGILNLISIRAQQGLPVPAIMTSFQRLPASLEIKYTAGYELLPESVKLAVLSMISRYANLAQGAGLSEIEIGDYRAKFVTDMSIPEKMALSLFMVREDTTDYFTGEIVEESVSS